MVVPAGCIVGDIRAWTVVLLTIALGGCGGSSPTAEPSSIQSPTTIDADAFDYDASAPLDVKETSRWRDGAVTVHELTYGSPHGGRVPALVAVPEGDGRFAGIVLQHGMPGTAEDMLATGTEFARLGAVAVMIDAPFARRAGEPVRFDERDRREQIQLIVDLRRAVDLLEGRRDVDPGRLGYLGISYGGAMGGLLAGVDKRVAAFVLAVGDGGLVEHFSSVDDAGGSLPPISAERRDRWLAAMRPIEPLAWIGRAEAALLFQNGRLDDVVPPADARRYHAAAPDDSEVRWYDSGHLLPASAVCDQARWFARRIGTSSKHSFCAAG